MNKAYIINVQGHCYTPENTIIPTSVNIIKD